MPQEEPIAIIGAGCRFPGSATSPSKLWEVLCAGKDLSKEIPIDRFNIDRFYHPDGNHHGTGNVKKTYFLDEDIRRFDAGFFSIPPGEAAAIDPQQRFLIETVFEAVEAAGLTISGLQGSDTAAYVGIMCMDYAIQAAQDFTIVPTYNATGVANSNASARLSYFFDWHGPAMTIDTACSSSLVAVHQAVQALRSGTSRVAVAAGTNLIASPLGYITESKLHMLSPTGYCQMWDQRADGYARGEGVAALILKKLSDAIADGDHVMSVIRETGINQDGRTNGITMPSARSQAALIRDTYARAGLDPLNGRDRCQYFEAHGTGTPAGDPQEAEALHSVFFPDASVQTDGVLHVGSLKTVIGHTEGTAGIAGILKASLAIQHGKIPPNLHFQSLSESVKPFYAHLNLVTSQQVWPTLPVGEPRRASVNSFGFGGTNAHAIIESYEQIGESGNPCTEQVERLSQTPSLPFLFSATSGKSLRALLDTYLTYLRSTDGHNLDDLAYTLACKRSAFQYRIAIAASARDELCQKIETYLSGDQSVFEKRTAISKSPSILAVFTGQGAQWPRMGRELLQTSTLAKDIIFRLDESLQKLPESDRPAWSLAREMEATSEDSRVAEASIAQPLTCAVQLVLVSLLTQAGVKFRAVVGHSSGEIAAAYAAGHISLEDAIRIAYYRGFHSKLAGNGQRGAMLAAGTSLEDAQELCAVDDLVGRVVVAASNSPLSVTLSGDSDAIEEVQNILEEEDKFARILKVDKAYHSHHMLPASEPFLESLRECNVQVLTPGSTAPEFFSSVYPGLTVDATTGLNGPYWSDNLKNPVLYYPALQNAARVCKYFDAVLEIGPHPALKGPSSSVLEEAFGHVPAYFGTLSRGKSDVEAFQTALGGLWTAVGGEALSFEQFHGTFHDLKVSPRMLPDLPNYPWDHDRVLWSESRSTKLSRQQGGYIHDLLGIRDASGTEEEWRWRNVLTTKEIPWLKDHALQGQTLFPATGYICLATEAALQIAGEQPVCLIEIRDLTYDKALIIGDMAGTETLVSLTKIQRSSSQITAAFACFSTIGTDSLELTLNSTGEVHITLGATAFDILPPRPQSGCGMAPVETEYFASELAKLGYDYGPTFRGITSIERKLGSSRGTIQNPASGDWETPLVFHPGMLDAALQGLLGAFSSPGDGRLWSLHAPSGVKCATLVPGLCGQEMPSEVSFDCTGTGFEANRFTGDVEVYHGDKGLKAISLEGVSFVPFTAATHRDDKTLFAQNVWAIDEPDAVLAMRDRRLAQAEIDKAMDTQRVAFYYMRILHETIEQAERAALNLPRHSVALLDAVDHHVDLVKKGEHAYVKFEYLNDSYEDILSIMAKYGSKDADFMMIEASGAHMPSVVRGETTMLEHMTEDDKLEYFYKNGIGLKELNDLIAVIIEQITHRYPKMSILEIGAGTGSASRSTLAKLGTAFSSYTYTDISSGFFGKAQEEFGMYKDRMIYKTLDITKDPTKQGFAHGSYDLVLASNVLHATPDLEQTLRNARSLLRPGGYLVLMEFVELSDTRMTLIFGGLPGWWVGADTGRRYSPCVTLPQWSDLMQRAGFSGVETSTPILDPVVTPASVLVSRAVDPDFNVLREPLIDNAVVTYGTSELVLLGGEKPGLQLAVEALVPLLQSHYKRILQVGKWENLIGVQLPKDCSVLNLSDFDAPFWNNLKPEKFNVYRDLLMSASNVLWATWDIGCENGDGATTLGFFRSLRYELPEVQLQIIDFQDQSTLDVALLATRLLRLEKSAQWAKMGSLDSRLWSVEPELRVRNGKVSIPRVKPQQEQNDRYNAEKRKITKLVDLRASIASAKWSPEEGQYFMREEEQSTLSASVGMRHIQIEYSLLPSINTSQGRLFFALGTDNRTHERVLAATNKQASQLLVPESWTINVKIWPGIESQYLSFLSGWLVCEWVSANVPSGVTVVIHEPDTGLASMLSKQLADLGSRAVYTTTNSASVRRNWIYVHPRTPDRQLKSLLPTDALFYCDLSSATNAAPEAVLLGVRIATLLPEFCEKRDHSILIAHESLIRTGTHDEKVQQLLSRAHEMAATQSSGVPDAMPLKLHTLSDLVSSNADLIEPLCILQWQGSPRIPCRIEPIYQLNDLFRSDKTYWLVGLAGDLGRSLCDFMVCHGARYVVLSSRNPKVESDWTNEHFNQGIKVLYIKADITNKDSLMEAHDTITRTMPPIGGVANGSLILHDKGFINMDVDTFHAQTRPKIEGTIYLDEMFTSDVDWFMAFSSVSSSIGNMGQMAYTAANMFMKALISQRRKRGLSGSVIDLSRILGVGYLERGLKGQNAASRDLTLRLIDRAGTINMSETDLHQIFAEAIIAGRAGSNADPEIITGVKPITSGEKSEALWGGNPRLGHYIQDLGAVSLPNATKSNAISVKTQLESVKDPQIATAIVKAAFIAKIKTSLMMTDDQVVSDTTSLIDLGVDSLVAVEIRTWFAHETGVDVAVLRILGGPSIEELVEEVVQKLPGFDQSSSSISSSSESESSGTQDADATSSRTSVDSVQKGDQQAGD